MEMQSDIPFEPEKLARTTDPGTSKAAAMEAGEIRASHHRKILEALSGMVDGTFYQIAAAAEMDVPRVWRRLNELEKAKAIETTGEEREGPTGRKCRVWRSCLSHEKTIRTDYTFSREDFEIEADASSGPITITLPKGIDWFKITKIDDSPNAVLVQLPPIPTEQTTLAETTNARNQNRSMPNEF